MSSTNKTTNYNLSQFVGTDVPSYLGDYNGDMSKIDKAIGDVANSQGSVEQSVVGLTADVQGLSTQVSGVSTSVQQLQTSVAQIDSAYKQADTALSQRITANANNIQTNTTAIEGINTTIGTEDISGIGDGTIKGAVSNLNSSLTGIKRFVDFNNKLFEKTYYNESFDYTATEDCFINCSVSVITQGKHSSITIENDCILAIVWGSITSNIGLSDVVQIYVKKGQTLHMASDETSSNNQSVFTVYGLQ